MGSSAPRPCAERRRARIAMLLAAAASAAGSFACVVMVAGAVATLAVAHAHEPDDTLPAAVRMDFVPPPAGSYALHAIMAAPDGGVLDPDGPRLPLARFKGDHIHMHGPH